MQKTRLQLIAALALLTLLSCSSGYNPMEDYEQLSPATILASPAAAADTSFPAAEVDRGKYLVGLLGCGSCHTDGALVGAPVPGRELAGSNTGIAYSNPMVQSRPGILYPANLTPDIATGIGNRSLEELERMIRTGVNEHGSQTLPVMPWPAYANIVLEDARAIAIYLKSLPPVNHKVPANVQPGQRSVAPFVHFGVYRSK